MLKKEKEGKDTEDNYDGDEFDQIYGSEEDEDYYKIVDEEIKMNSSLGKKDNQVLKDIISKSNKELNTADSNDSDEVDEYLKKHMNIDKKPQTKPKI